MGTEMILEDQVVDSIAKLASKATEPRILKEFSNPFEEVVAINGSLERFSKTRSPVNQVFRTPADLKSYLQSLGSPNPHSSVLVGESGIVFYPSLDERRIFDRTPLTLTASIMWLKSPASLRQADFVRLLRTTLDGTLPDGSLLSRARKVKFRSEGQASGVVMHGHESLDRSMLSQLEESSTLPEEVLLSVQVYQQTSIRYPIRCTLDVDPQSQEFKLAPLPNEIWNATTSALSSIAEALEFDGGPNVFLGEAEGVVKG
jgi:hypothetical protein